MAITQTDICNKALLLASQPQIQAITDDNPRSRACRAFYETSKNALLSEENWNFAQFRVSLAQSSIVPEYGFAHQFALPTNPRYLRLIEHDKCVSMEWRIENQFFLCDESAISIVYVGEAAENLFSDAFVQAFSAYLAYQIAPVLDQDQQLAERLYGLYQRNMAMAKHVDALATKSRRVGRDHPRSYLRPDRRNNGRSRF